MMPFCRHPSANSAMCVLQIGNDTAGSNVVVYLCRCKGYVAQQDCEDQGCHQLCRAPSCCCMTNSGYHAHLGIRLFVQTLTSHGVSVAIVRCHGHLLRSLPLSAMACSQIESAKADCGPSAMSQCCKSSAATTIFIVSHFHWSCLFRTAVPLFTKVRSNKVTAVDL